MKKEELLECNKLILDYMGFVKSSEDKDFCFYEHKGINLGLDYSYNPIKRDLIEVNFGCHFDKDWNWLIPVVEKIEIQSKELFGAYEDVIINGCGCGISTKDDMISIAATSKIEAVYIACVEYIKWYNEQNKK